MNLCPDQREDTRFHHEAAIMFEHYASGKYFEGNLTTFGPIGLLGWHLNDSLFTFILGGSDRCGNGCDANRYPATIKNKQEHPDIPSFRDAAEKDASAYKM